MSENRLIDLETKFSFQDHEIKELQNTVHEQYLIITKLEKKFELLSEQLKAYATESNPIGPASQKPPHY